jgi:predicted phosphoribosyltransferase
MNVIVKRNHLFREGRPYPSLQNKNIIVVDDGLASGYTMLAAVRFIKRRNPCKIIAAVPTASKRTIEFILSETDELVCLNVRSRFPFAVADAYVKWHDLTDKEVLDIIKRSHKEKKGKVGA